jgi:hypothetical protein
MVKKNCMRRCAIIYICSSPNIIRMIKPNRMGWKTHVARTRKINVYKMLNGKPEGEILLGRPRCGCEDNIKMDLTNMRWECED